MYIYLFIGGCRQDKQISDQRKENFQEEFGEDNNSDEGKHGGF